MNWLKIALLSIFLFGCGNSDRGKAYVTSQKGGVSVIDLNSMEIIEEINVRAEFPRGIGVTDDGKYLITANKGNANLSIINLKTKEVKNVDVGINPEFVRVYKGQVFVSTEPSSKGKPPAKGEMHHEEEEDDDEEKIPAKVAVVNLVKGKKIREITAGPETEGIEFSKDGKQIIVTNEADNSITIHDYESGDLLKTFFTEPYGLRPRGIKVSPDGNFYVATLEFSNNFIVLDKEFNHVKTVKTGKSPYGISFNSKGDKLYVAAGRARTLEVFNGRDFTKINELKTDGKRCWHFTFTPDNKDLMLACGRSDEVLLIDSETLNIKKRIPVAGIPWGIVTYPKAIGSLDQVK
jgi:DNA-binding beta-propeller fold protein YncE